MRKIGRGGLGCPKSLCLSEQVVPGFHGFRDGVGALPIGCLCWQGHRLRHSRRPWVTDPDLEALVERRRDLLMVDVRKGESQFAVSTGIAEGATSRSPPPSAHPRARVSMKSFPSGSWHIARWGGSPSSSWGSR